MNNTCKRTLATLLAAVMLLAVMPLTAAAEKGDRNELPFTLNAPVNVAVDKVPGDSPTTLSVGYSKDEALGRFLGAYEENGPDWLYDEGWDDPFFHAQIDWAIDDPVDGWHYNQWWDGNAEDTIGFDDDDNPHYSDWDYLEAAVSPETVDWAWVLRGCYDVEEEDGGWRWVGDEGTLGVRDQLKEDQYTLDEDGVHIDYAAHTVYVRVRYHVGFWHLVGPEGEAVWEFDNYFSDWSDIAAYGKDAPVWEPYTAETIPVPEIADFRITDDIYNANPVAAYTLAVPEDLAENATQIEARDGVFRLIVEARLKGDEAWTELDGDWIVRSGEMKTYLENLAAPGKVLTQDSAVEMRCYYWCSQYVGGEWFSDVRSDYSKTLSFGAGIFLLGDAEWDGDVDAADALMTLQMATGKLRIEPDAKRAGDVNGDENITAEDALMILQFVTEKINTFPAGTPEFPEDDGGIGAGDGTGDIFE